MKMNINFLHQLPIENLSLNTIPLAILLVGMAEFLIFHGIFDLGKKFYNFFSGSHSEASFGKSKVEISNNSCKYFDINKNRNLGLSQKVQTLIGNEEVEIVLESLGMFSQPEEGGNIQGKLNYDDLFNLFEEDSPSIDEAKECFGVFDENRDGFIDANELQRVLLALGFNEGSELENCKRMIRVHDENDDDKIDFNEFLGCMGTIEC
ncbi:hypothetical protein LIER_00388 [Lithospermum erythrorhizon]|uniref:EF-hand domain-containing protein n=1 Tax=Lithospermum erythrorhizon TaxID=34254 RepID=A0AAV3NLP0_LITER